MIRINIVRENEMIKRVSFEGHADYEEYGKDIVCAAVSATYLCTVNAILDFDDDSIMVNSSDNLQEIVVVKSDDITLKLLNNMIRCLLSLEKQYPKNINFR